MKRNLFCKLGLHDWEYFYEPFVATFLDEKYTAYSAQFRICRKCGKAQMEDVDEEGIYYININSKEKEILLKRIQEGVLISEIKIGDEPKKET